MMFLLCLGAVHSARGLKSITGSAAMSPTREPRPRGEWSGQGRDMAGGFVIQSRQRLKSNSFNREEKPEGEEHRR